MAHTKRRSGYGTQYKRTGYGAGYRLGRAIIPKGDKYHLEVLVAVTWNFDIQNPTLKISDTKTDTTMFLPSKPDSVTFDPERVLFHWTRGYKALAEEGKADPIINLLHCSLLAK